MEYKAPNKPQPKKQSDVSLFLAGSIEMGKAIDWQAEMVDNLSNLNIDIFNPRRDDWDNSWGQRITDPQFNEQVNWELDMINLSDYVLMYFDPGTTSPISLLELGHLSGRGDASDKVVVVCPEGFYRKGNVEIVCERARIKMLDTLDHAVIWLEATIRERRRSANDWR